MHGCVLRGKLEMLCAVDKMVCHVLNQKLGANVLECKYRNMITSHGLFLKEIVELYMESEYSSLPKGDIVP